jgi:very-short-patch-repair endonuclease
MMSRIKRVRRLHEFAKKLRREMTVPERLLWTRLRGNQLLGVGFRRQEPVVAYIADFLSHSKKVVIEVDGHTHGDDSLDAARDHWFAGAGYRTLRFSNAEVMADIDGVLATIAREIEATPTLARRQRRET